VDWGNWLFSFPGLSVSMDCAIQLGTLNIPRNSIYPGVSETLCVFWRLSFGSSRCSHPHNGFKRVPPPLAVRLSLPCPSTQPHLTQDWPLD